MQFPLEMPPGKRIPFWSQIPGRSFRMRADPETASHSGAEIWDTLSAGSQHDKRRGPIPAIRGQALALEQIYPALTSRQTKSAWYLPVRRSFLTSLRKATLREDHVAFILPSKELTSIHELLQHVSTRRFIAPFALRKQRGALAIVNNQVDFFLRMRAIIRPRQRPTLAGTTSSWPARASS